MHNIIRQPIPHVSDFLSKKRIYANHNILYDFLYRPSLTSLPVPVVVNIVAVAKFGVSCFRTLSSYIAYL